MTTDAIPNISTGNPSLDDAIGVGGLPRGRVVDIVGSDDAGKDALAWRAIAAAQEAGRVCAYIDARHACILLDAQGAGVDLGKLLVSQPERTERVRDIINTLVRSGAVDLIVVDGLELEPYPAATFMRKLTPAVARSGACVAFVRGLSGSTALKFYASLRLDVRPLDERWSRVKVIKNKLAPPFREATVRRVLDGYLPVDSPCPVCGEAELHRDGCSEIG